MLEDMRRAGQSAAQARGAEDERAARERAQAQMSAMHLASAGSGGPPAQGGGPPHGYGAPHHGAQVPPGQRGTDWLMAFLPLAGKQLSAGAGQARAELPPCASTLSRLGLVCRCAVLAVALFMCTRRKLRGRLSAVCGAQPPQQPSWPPQAYSGYAPAQNYPPPPQARPVSFCWALCA